LLEGFRRLIPDVRSYDTTDKTNPTVISKTTYNGVAYCHQGWWIDDKKQEWMLMDDELDEERKKGPSADGKPTTYIWDLRSLEKPVQTGFFKGEVVSIDHNQYIYDGFSYQSNYGSGLRVMDVRSIPQDPTGKSVKEVGFFDIFPEDDQEVGGGSAEFIGTWSSYAGFKSGYVFVNSIERGGFVLKLKNDSRD
jgi:choice-of-anchor B domain-containing protein